MENLNINSELANKLKSSIIRRLKGYRNTNEEIVNTNGIVRIFGKHLDINNFNESDVDIDEVIEGLCKINRFAGSTVIPYTVAEHSIAGATSLLTFGYPKEAYYFLFHECAESFTGDIISNIKTKEIKEFEAKLEEIIFKVLEINLNEINLDLCKMVDLNLYELEIVKYQLGSEIGKSQKNYKELEFQFRELKGEIEQFLLWEKEELKTDLLKHTKTAEISKIPSFQSFIASIISRDYINPDFLSINKVDKMTYVIKLIDNINLPIDEDVYIKKCNEMITNKNDLNMQNIINYIIYNN